MNLFHTHLVWVEQVHTRHGYGAKVYWDFQCYNFCRAALFPAAAGSARRMHGVAGGFSECVGVSKCARVFASRVNQQNTRTLPEEALCLKCGSVLFLRQGKECVGAAVLKH